MNKVTKSPAQEQAERREAAELQQKIIRATDGIPRHVMDGSQQVAAAFKEHALKARKMATNRRYASDVWKMREAWNLISGYYSTKIGG